jgi:hypothetical protein
MNMMPAKKEFGEPADSDAAAKIEPVLSEGMPQQPNNSYTQAHIQQMLDQQPQM